MPEFTVELSFEYKSSYTVIADTGEEAMEAAAAYDEHLHRGTPWPGRCGDGVSVTMDADREFADFLDSRVFEDGEEIIYD